MSVQYKITRDDQKEDHIAGLIFDTYDEAHMCLEEYYSDICCSDADYEDRLYYDIIEFID